MSDAVPARSAALLALAASQTIGLASASVGGLMFNAISSIFPQARARLHFLPSAQPLALAQPVALSQMGNGAACGAV